MTVTARVRVRVNARLAYPGIASSIHVCSVCHQDLHLGVGVGGRGTVLVAVTVGVRVWAGLAVRGSGRGSG